MFNMIPMNGFYELCSACINSYFTPYRVIGWFFDAGVLDTVLVHPNHCDNVQWTSVEIPCADVVVMNYITGTIRWVELLPYVFPTLLCMVFGMCINITAFQTTTPYAWIYCNEVWRKKNELDTNNCGKRARSVQIYSWIWTEICPHIFFSVLQSSLTTYYH